MPHNECFSCHDDSVVSMPFLIYTASQSASQTDRQTDRQAGRQADRQTDRQP